MSDISVFAFDSYAIRMAMVVGEPYQENQGTVRVVGHLLSLARALKTSIHAGLAAGGNHGG